MTIVLCVDNRFGMLFNGRRQSKDSQLRMRLLERVGDKILRTNAYSAEQFSDLPQNLQVQENFLQAAEPGDVCFVEDMDCSEYLDKCRRLILYCWNRSYPADLYFPEQILNQWTLVETSNFMGSSHERITENVYEKA